MKAKNQKIVALETQIVKPLQKMRNYYNKLNWEAFDQEMSTIMGTIRKDQLYKHNFTYEWFMLMNVNSWVIRKNKQMFLKSL